MGGGESRYTIKLYNRSATLGTKLYEREECVVVGEGKKNFSFRGRGAGINVLKIPKRVAYIGPSESGRCIQHEKRDLEYRGEGKFHIYRFVSCPK